MKKKTPKERLNWFRDRCKELENDPNYIAAGYMIAIGEKWYVKMEELKWDYKIIAEKAGKSKSWVQNMFECNSSAKLVDIIIMNEALGMDMIIDVKGR